MSKEDGARLMARVAQLRTHVGLYVKKNAFSGERSIPEAAELESRVISGLRQRLFDLVEPTSLLAVIKGQGFAVLDELDERRDYIPPRYVNTSGFNPARFVPPYPEVYAALAEDGLESDFRSREGSSVIEFGIVLESDDRYRQLKDQQRKTQAEAEVQESEIAAALGKKLLRAAKPQVLLAEIDGKSFVDLVRLDAERDYIDFRYAKATGYDPTRFVPPYPEVYEELKRQGFQPELRAGWAGDGINYYDRYVDLGVQVREMAESG